jgi:hypothetical protein
MLKKPSNPREPREPTEADLQDPTEARYANYFKVGFNEVEFLLDFGQQHDGGKALIHTRIVISPGYVQSYLTLLMDSIAAYERASYKN